MTDRELLELAAKAAGIETFWGLGWESDYMYRSTPRPNSPLSTNTRWNPLDGDGDALRLAVKLHICTIFPMRGDTYKQCGAGQVGSERPAVMEPHDPDPLAATRRAIVRAAAEIGRKLR